MPCFRDTDNLIYSRSEAGGALFGGYEPNPVSRWQDGVPWQHAAANLRLTSSGSPSWWSGAARRFPFLEDAGMVTLECHPDAMTPDEKSAAGADAGCGRLLDGGRAVAERLRRRRWHRTVDR